MYYFYYYYYYAFKNRLVKRRYRQMDFYKDIQSISPIDYTIYTIRLIKDLHPVSYPVTVSAAAHCTHSICCKSAYVLSFYRAAWNADAVLR